MLNTLALPVPPPAVPVVVPVTGCCANAPGVRIVAPRRSVAIPPRAAIRENFICLLARLARPLGARIFPGTKMERNAGMYFIEELGSIPSGLRPDTSVQQPRALSGVGHTRAPRLSRPQEG